MLKMGLEDSQHSHQQLSKPNPLKRKRDWLNEDEETLLNGGSKEDPIEL